MSIKATVVFQRNWEAIHEVKEDGQRKYRYLINSGSSRSSKTHSFIQILYLYALNNPNKKCSVFRETKTNCKLTVFEDMVREYPKMPYYDRVTLNLTESVFKFPNGSSIHIEGTDDPVKVHGYQSNVLWFNEGYDISKDTFDQLDQRCSDFVLVDLNPRVKHWSEDIAKAQNSILIHSTFNDNPFCPPEQRNKILSYQPLSLCAAVVDGVISEKELREYDLTENKLDLDVDEILRCMDNEHKNSANAFNWQVYGLGLKAEKPNRIFNFSEISDQEYQSLDVPIYTGVDWGAVDPWGIVDVKYYDGALYLHERNYQSENDIRQKLTTTERIQIESAEEGIVKWMFSKLDLPKNRYLICDNNREAKIIALRSAGWEYAIAARKGRGSILDGIDKINNMRVYFTSSSTNLKYEQENYSRKIDRYGVILEEPEDNNNHTLDPVRYVVDFLESEGIIKKV